MVQHPKWQGCSHGKKKIDSYIKTFENSDTLQKVAWIKFFFGKDMAKRSIVAIEKEWAQLCYCLKHGGMNAIINKE